MNFSVDHYGSRLDLRLESRVFAYREVTGRLDVTLDLAIDDEVVLKLDGPLDLDIRGKDIAGVSRGRLPGGYRRAVTRSGIPAGRRRSGLRRTLFGGG